MNKLEIDVEGKQVRVNIPPPQDGVQSCFVFGAHKSGSTLLNRMVLALCRKARFPTIDFPSAFFRAGARIDSTENAALVREYLLPEGYVYLGSRTFWCRELGLDFSAVKKVLLLRDPRDAIISWFFSDKVSHGIPKDHKEFAALRDELQTHQDPNEHQDYLESRARSLAALCSQYKELLTQDDIAIYRYEDVIFRKRLWLLDLNNHMGLDVSREDVFEIADSFDEVPAKEDPNKFVRQVNPGNHLKHFSKDTIAMLDEILGEFLQTFRYDRIDRFMP